MATSTSGRVATLALIGLCCWLLSSQNVTAHSPTRVLVVVADVSDAACVKRIGRDHVQVELLFAPEVGARPSNYQACAERARKLIKFQMFVFRGECPSEAFWLERMAAANPDGKLHRLTHSRCATADDREKHIQRASEVHRLLLGILPRQQADLDANLKAELRRLRMVPVNLPRLALVD